MQGFDIQRRNVRNTKARGELTFDMDYVGCEICIHECLHSRKQRSTNVVSSKKRQVLDQSHIHYITYYRSYKRTGTLINTLHIYYDYSTTQTRYALSRNRFGLSLKIIIVFTKLGSVMTVLLSDTIASNEKMRGTEYIGFDFG